MINLEDLFLKILLFQCCTSQHSITYIISKQHVKVHNNRTFIFKDLTFHFISRSHIVASSFPLVTSSAAHKQLKLFSILTSLAYPVCHSFCLPYGTKKFLQVLAGIKSCAGQSLFEHLGNDAAIKLQFGEL